jgi:hypothetical protein
VEGAPPEYLPVLETTLKLRVSRQTVLQRAKRGELEAVRVTQGRRKGLRIKVVDRPMLGSLGSVSRKKYWDSCRFRRLSFDYLMEAGRECSKLASRQMD